MEEMQDLTGNGETVGDDQSFMSDVNSNPSSISDKSSFRGFGSDLSCAPTPQTKYSSSSSSTKGKKKDKAKLKNSNKRGSRDKFKLERNPHPPAPETPSTSSETSSEPAQDHNRHQQDLNAITASILSVLQPQIANLQTAMNSRLSNMEAHLSNHPTPSTSTQPTQGMPPSDNLPPFDPSNPWRPAIYAPVSDGTLTIEGVGTRPISDFEIFPHGASPPFCFVRLREEASIREDRVPRETVLFPKDRAQNCLLKFMKDAKCDNSRIPPQKGGLTMFTTNKAVPNPFLTKVLEAVNMATQEDKPTPPLKEEDPVSLLFPGDSTIWEGVVQTFSAGKLPPECASTQFDEDLPKVPDFLLKAEFEARSRLEKTLNCFTLMEVTSLSLPTYEILKVITKSMVPLLRQDLSDFALARRNCRKHVLKHASIRHEPSMLINGSIWGKGLFPEDKVKKVIDNATQSSQNLRTRWNLPLHKRKFQEGTAPQTKNSPHKKFKGQQYRIPKFQQQRAYMVPVSPQGHHLREGQRRQLFLLNPQQSPAFNPAYEGSASFRQHGPGPMSQARGARGIRGRGTGRGNQQVRGRARQQRSRGVGRGTTSQ